MTSYIERIGLEERGFRNQWWQHVLHNQTALQIKGALLFKKGVIVTRVPYHLKR